MKHKIQLLVLLAVGALVAGLLGPGFVNACGPFFYAAPPPLSAYPERFAVKTWEDQFLEESPVPEDAMSAEAMQEAIGGAITAWLDGVENGERLAARFEDLIVANRGGHYRAHFANLLHEMVELTAVSEPGEARAYAQWRLQQLEQELERPRAGTPRPSADTAREKWQCEGEEREALLAIALDRSTPALRPHWLIQRAAWRLARRELDEAAADVALVLKQSPDSGRGEVALLLAGRVELVRSRELRRAAREAWLGPEDTREARDAAFKAGAHFRDYEERWPDGRFLADVIGWQGAVASDAGYWTTAIGHHVRQLEAQPTREVRRAVYRECNMLFGRLLRADDLPGPWSFDQLADGLARHPVLALGLVYHCLDTEVRADFQEYFNYENYDSDAGWLRFLERRVVRPRQAALPLLEALAAAVAVARTTGPDLEAVDPRALLVLAWVSSEQGEYARAQALLDRLPEAAASHDEVLDLRAHVARLQGRFDDSLAALNELQARHPDSALTRDLVWRKGESLWRAGRPAEAIRVLWSARPERFRPVPMEERELPLRSSFELEQMIDALLQFAPLEDLLPLVEDEDQELAQLARRILRARAFAAGDFELAMSDALLSDPVPQPQQVWPQATEGVELRGYLGRESVERLAGPVAAAQQAVASAGPGPERAAAQLALARAWWEERGFLTMPSKWAFHPSMNEGELTEQRQRENARHLGLADDEATFELDRRDEAWHALQAALKAAEEDAAGAAPALALANECLLRLAELSAYQQQRAIETGAAARSRSLVVQLQREHPDAPETAAAVAWTFAAHPQAKPWNPADEVFWQDVGQLALAVSGSGAAHWQPAYGGRAAAADWMEKLAQTGRQLGRGDLTRESALVQVSQLGEEFLETYESLFQAWFLNHLDDLTALLATERGTEQELAAYFELRLGEDVPDVDSPEWEHLGDFVRFLEIVRRPDLESPESWADYLNTFPDSPKAEAADFRRIRLLCRAQRQPPRREVEPWPRSTVPKGGRTIGIPRTGPMDPATLLAEIAGHLDKFHPARYQHDLRLLEAGARDDAGEPSRALALIAAVLLEPAARDLHQDAGLLLQSHAVRLMDPGTRAEALAAFRESPEALDLLRKLIAGQSFLSRLQPMLMEL